MDYPKRPPYFAHKFLRSLIKQASAQEIGPEGMCLLTCVAMTEDSKGYTDAVTFYNGQLMPLCGFTNEKRLVSVRAKCVERGLLHYEPGGKGVAGRYWCIPTNSPRGDGPVDENPTELVPENSTGQVQEKVRTSSGEGKDNARTSAGEPTVSLPIPKPSPIPKKRTAAVAAAYSSDFEDAWEAYRPTARGGQEKPESFRAWQKAMALIRERDDVDDAHDWLLQRIQDYAAIADEFSPVMHRWLKKAKYDDDLRGRTVPKKFNGVLDFMEAGNGPG